MLSGNGLVFLLEWLDSGRDLLLYLLHLALNGIQLFFRMSKFQNLIEAAHHFGSELVEDEHDVLAGHWQVTLIFVLLEARLGQLLPNLFRIFIIFVPRMLFNPKVDLFDAVVVDLVELRFHEEFPSRAEINATALLVQALNVFLKQECQDLACDLS